MSGLDQPLSDASRNKPSDQLSSDGTPSIVLVGLMGAGKSCIGKRLAEAIGWHFIDADSEIEKAAGCSIADIFERHGEQAFRDGEKRVIERLLQDGPSVIATGGGAFMNAETRAAIRAKGISVWLRADLEVLLRRTGRRDHRPLLKKGDPKQILTRLMEERYPVYAEADVVVESVDRPAEETTRHVLDALRGHGVVLDAG